jgi:preprotein translocase subunit YajC
VEYLIPIAILLLLLWLVVARPQRRRQMSQLQMQDTLELGDEVITAGGMHGTVRRLDEDVLTIEIAPDTEVRVDRRAIAAVVRPEHEPEPEDG